MILGKFRKFPWKVFLMEQMFSKVSKSPKRILKAVKYCVSPRIQSECGKIRTRETPNMDTFYAVIVKAKVLTSQKSSIFNA